MWETGKRTPDFETLIRLSDLLNSTDGEDFLAYYRERKLILRVAFENLLHPYYSINHKIFSGSKQNIQLPQKDLKYPFLLNLVLP